MKLQTPVADDLCKVGISFNDKITMLGSCFSDNIGRQLSELGFDVCVNPFGTLYNPISIQQSVERLISRQEFTEKDCINIGAGDERFCSFSHHTSFARVGMNEFIENANQALHKASEHFAESTKVIITLGTAWCFRHKAEGKVVSNCLKRPAAEFTRERLTTAQTTEALKKIMEMCQEAAHQSADFRQKEFIFTVSPIRHFKDGAHGNQLSKGTLLIGIDQAIHSREDIVADYFPSYEIVMDELRDYRFYAEDMCHPTQQTVDYIRERFLSWALPEKEHPHLEENIRTLKRSRHISL